MAKNKVIEEGALHAGTKKIINDNFADVARCTSQFLVDSGSTGTTLANVTGLVTDTLQPGTYRFYINLITTATTNSGLKVALKQSVSSMLSSIQASVRAMSASAVAASTFTTATDAASIVAATAAYVNVVIEGTLVIPEGKAGTLQLQAAQNASHADDTTVEVGSYMEFTKIG